MTTKKTKTTTANVAEKKTNVAKKATEQVKRPTIKSLQEEAKNLTEQLVYANSLVIQLEEQIKAYDISYTNFQTREKHLNARIKELEERSILGQILYSITKRFK